MTTLRPYQQAAISATWDYLRANDGHPVIELPTGAGKTPVLVNMARAAVEEWGGRVLILAHVKELLAQAAEKFQAWWPMAPVGVYSAGLGRRDTGDAIMIAGIQSVYARAAEIGHRDLVIVDEAHLIPATGDGMYLSLLRDLKAINPRLRVVGLTATPYRLDAGLIAPGPIFSDVAYRAKVRDLIDQGYLSPLRGKAGTEADLSGVHIRGGEYVPAELEAALADEETVALASAEIVRHCADRKAWVIFCAGVKHADMVAAALFARGIAAPVITGETPTGERDAVIEAFKQAKYRALININVLSIGFDAPHVDAVVMLRPTQSAGLYYQQVGRGLRLAPGKTDCLILDLAGNIRRHGPIDLLDPVAKKKRKGEGDEAPTKTCPECQEIVACAVRACPACGHEFPPPPVAKHETKADAAAPLSGPPIEERVAVTGVTYGSHLKRGALADAPRTLRVSYELGMATVSEWVCFEHPPGGFARRKAEQWWSKRSPTPPPATVADALAAIGHDFREPSAITVRHPVTAKGFPEVIAHHFANPCASCRFFDAGACGKWNADVPAEHQASGCDAWEAGTVPALAADEEPPF